MLDINRIKNLEEQLRVTMINSDAETLELLLNDDLKFVAPNGNIITKSDDLYGYKNNLQKIDEIEILTQDITCFDEFAIVITKAKVQGSYNAVDMSGTFVYQRVWKAFGNKIQVISGSLTVINK